MYISYWPANRGKVASSLLPSKPWQPPHRPALPSPAAGSPFISACAAATPISMAAATAHTCNLFRMSLPSRCLSVIPLLRTRFRSTAGGNPVYYRLHARRQSPSNAHRNASPRSSMDVCASVQWRRRLSPSSYPEPLRSDEYELILLMFAVGAFDRTVIRRAQKIARLQQVTDAKDKCPMWPVTCTIPRKPGSQWLAVGVSRQLSRRRV